MKVYLRDLAFSSAREVEVTTNKKAIIIMVRSPRTPRKRLGQAAPPVKILFQDLRLGAAPLLFSWG